MNLRDEIKTIDEFAEVSNVINKSNFIAQVYHVYFEKQVIIWQMQRKNIMMRLIIVMHIN
jgi:hypothetical protein